MLAVETKVLVRKAQKPDAKRIAEIYSSVFGEAGIKAAGHEPYPAPDMFSVEGIIRVIEDPDRELLVVEADNIVGGGMVIHRLSPYHVEFACVAVDPSFRGLGLSPRLLQGARKIAAASLLTLNNTEIVTHSIHSQCAHARAGYHRVTGFNFCQYPRVFFKNHEESCSWVSRQDGLVVERLKGNCANQSAQTEEELALYQSLKDPRQVFVPETMTSVARKILDQFADTLSYEVSSKVNESIAATSANYEAISLDEQPGEPFSYLYLPGEQPKENTYSELEQLIEKAKALPGKHYIQARLSANSKACIDYAEFLEKHDFLFMGLLPLYNHKVDETTGNIIFGDVLLMQWICPDVLKRNSLPGETDSVPKLHGFPLGINGAIIKTMRAQLNRA